ncbi:aminoglycoside adenylyltransferase domain-containing protein [Rossellomorea sp. NPDC071047]|uniref:aminoglycoside adenylyltransferase domain-containing protein n=1 Tax=Rossellomorea sp. NPDC071047 TaxID=3390675 RepID=UPI003D027FA9
MARLPSVVQAVLNDYLILFNKYLPNTMKGVYLHGSISLDAYVNNSSDIDFIAVTRRRMTSEDAESLFLIHKELALTYPKPEMDGVYITQEEIGKLSTNNTNEYQENAYYNSGELKFGEYFNFNPITWYLFKHMGISVMGSDTASFDVTISLHQLSSYVHSNMNSYWMGRVSGLENSIEDVMNYPTEIIDNEIEWSVLGLLRQYYTLRESGITSKQEAGEYGLQHLQDEWHKIISEAMNIRDGLRVSLFNSEEERIKHTLEFAKYIISYCNDLFFPTNLNHT